MHEKWKKRKKRRIQWKSPPGGVKLFTIKSKQSALFLSLKDGRSQRKMLTELWWTFSNYQEPFIFMHYRPLWPTVEVPQSGWNVTTVGNPQCWCLYSIFFFSFYALQTPSTHGQSPVTRLKCHDGRESPVLVFVRHLFPFKSLRVIFSLVNIDTRLPRSQRLDLSKTSKKFLLSQIGVSKGFPWHQIISILCSLTEPMPRRGKL